METVLIKEREKAKKAKESRRQSYFCIGVSKVWTGARNIPKIIKRLKKKHGIGWLRPSMSYHRFTNLSEMFQGDLTTKLNENLE